MQKASGGFLGNKEVQNCALCNQQLGDDDRQPEPLILTICSHKFHYKCFNEELKHGSKREEVGGECPICKKEEIKFDGVQQPKSKKGKKKKSSKQPKEEKKEGDKEPFRYGMNNQLKQFRMKEDRNREIQL